MLKEDLKDLVKQAFLNTRKPSPGELTSHDCVECDKVEKDFSRFIVQSLPHSVLEYHKDSLPFFTGEALHYFLPQYLLYSIEHPDSEFTDYTVYHLSPGERDTPYWVERLSIFSDQERTAICKYFAYLKQLKSSELLDNDIAIAEDIWCINNK